MKSIKREFVLAASAAGSSRWRLVVMVITIALFILSAGAPNATIGIGK